MDTHTTSKRNRRRPSPNWVIGGALVAVMTGWMIVSPVVGQSPASAVSGSRLWASNCAQCHGTNGQSGAIDQLAGDPVSDTVSKMKDQRTHNSIMGAVARGLTDAEVQAIAEYFASIPKQ